MVDAQRSGGESDEGAGTGRIRRLVLGLSVAVVVGWILVRWPSVPFTILGGVLVALILDAGMWPLLRRGWGRVPAMALLMAVVVPVLAAAGWWAFPSLVEQGRQLVDILPDSWADLREYLGKIPGGSTAVGAIEGQGGEGAGDMITGFLGRIGGWLGGAVVVVLHVVLMLVLGVYFALQPGIYRRGTLLLVARRRREEVDVLLRRLRRDLQRWLLGKLLAMSVIGVASTVGLWLMGVPLALVNGLLAGLLSFVPNFGPIASLVPPLLLALGESPRLALWVVLLYAGIQTAESYVVTPQIMRRVIAVPPGLILTGQLVLGSLLGPYGVVFAVPCLIIALDVIASRRGARPYDTNNHGGLDDDLEVAEKDGNEDAESEGDRPRPG